MFTKISDRLIGRRKRKELADKRKGLADQRKALSDSARMAQSIVEICSVFKNLRKTKGELLDILVPSSITDTKLSSSENPQTTEPKPLDQNVEAKVTKQSLLEEWRDLACVYGPATYRPTYSRPSVLHTAVDQQCSTDVIMTAVECGGGCGVAFVPTLAKLRKEREKFLNPYLAPSTIAEVLKLPREEIPILQGTDDLTLYDLGLFIEEYRIFDNIWISKKELFDEYLLPRPITETKLASSETPQATKEQQLNQDVNEQAASDTKALTPKVIPKAKVDNYFKSAGPLALVSTKPTDPDVHSTPVIPTAKVDNHFKAAGPLPLVATKPSDSNVHPKVSSAIISKAKVEHHIEAAGPMALVATKSAESKAQPIVKMDSGRQNEDPATIIFFGYGGHRYILPFESCRL
ncbi:hypothetical protein QBC37DRAFT_398283 [Rhypophila decipiens]|uniref:Uncharacterized protein n=1 Tax=Rhypophila decipiens TaxID=261697 RepID=A0AAN6YD84_9PEZI|nr:hypothetical protein QBC37DRAFT_398283 [Rhypophila decipiens]